MEKTLILSLLVFSTLISNIKTETYSLTIKTNGLENSDGTIVFAIYNKDGSIPDQKFKNYFKKENALIVNNKSEITFNNLPKGLYTVTVLHDENKNGKIDTKFMVPLPDEGVGFSNYDDFGLSNRPNFKKASFNLSKNTTVIVKVIYK
ncbi:DUF2141 domain-containing protein [Bizionia argentinensis JUB59]|uniref:DUF2141 domain-containing protein n=1 Tax=Bizionia argentinensis JUB59 TaxID=1046627 RepID=G2E9L3_9FLAO|nr:DUF2141 domain-containing protein [Bizionia argentinensis]EGV45000.1 DUF2141 domain-containing protein [Bizionia argentinensis JUB59]